MKMQTLKFRFTIAALAMSTWLAAEPPPASTTQPAYLNRGAPFSLRKAPRHRPPAYSLPPLPIHADPQPMALTSINAAQPLNPANAANPLPQTVPMILAPPTPGMKLETKTVVFPIAPMGTPMASPQTGGVRSPMGGYLDPQILKYMNIDANGTYQGGLLPNSSLFTVPTLNPLFQRGSSATYEIK